MKGILFGRLADLFRRDLKAIGCKQYMFEGELEKSSVVASIATTDADRKNRLSVSL